MKRKILLFGAGKSATSLIDYLIDEALDNNWSVQICDASLEVIEKKINGRTEATAVAIDVTENLRRQELIADADIVISLLPPALHLLVAKDCIQFKKSLLTASYVDEEMRKLSSDIADAGVLFLCEMGLDPGIDHMSAMKIIDQVHDEGGTITSFISHCGGLVAPESDDNPWHYKISWNPRNIVMAGKSGAKFKKDGKVERIPHEYLFDYNQVINHDELGWLAYYPNRDSLEYMELYGLESSSTFMRTTLRYPEFCFGWKNIIELKLTDEHQRFDTTGLTVKQFFAEHLARFNATGIIAEKISGHLSVSKSLLEDLQDFTDAAENDELSDDADNRNERAEDTPKNKDYTGFAIPDNSIQTEELDPEEIKLRAAQVVAVKLHETNMLMEQLAFLDLNSTEEINLGRCAAIDVLQWILEKKLALKPGDKDMIVMLHQIQFTGVDGQLHEIESSLVVKGEDHIHTAMAKTVGLPLGIAAKFILDGKIKSTGLKIPVDKEIYLTVLKELETYGISFKEKIL